MLLLRRRVGTRRREGSGSREEEGGAEAEMEEAAEECHQLPGILSAAKHSRHEIPVSILGLPPAKKHEEQETDSGCTVWP